MRQILVYGSLRQLSSRGYNCGRLGRQLYLDTDTVKGFQLWAKVNYSYPVALFTGNSNDKIIVEVHEVEDYVFDKIFNMEIMAGYKAMVVETNSGYTGTLFFVDKLNPSAMIVEGGDWR